MKSPPPNDIFGRFGLRRVINVSGTETPYGASPVREEVLQAVLQLVPHSVMMHELQTAASATIARATGAEAGCVTGCTAASIAMSVAGAMTGTDLGRVEQLPDTSGMKQEVVLQRGHEVSYGHHVSQNARIAGARIVEIGAVHQTGLYQLRHALNENTAAGLYVVSHLVAPHGMIPLEEFIAACSSKRVPVIVDAASVSNPKPFIQAGADLVLWSAHKGFKSLTAGYVAGRRELVQACLFQEHGIGRPMKVGKEGVIAAIAALEAWEARDVAGESAKLSARIGRVVNRLGALPGVRATPQDRQVSLRIDSGKSGVTAAALAAWLAHGNPAIIVWHHRALDGELLVTLSNVDDGTADSVCDAIERGLAGEAKSHEGRWVSVADQFERAVASWLAKPASSPD